jgi:glycosyltransferase involved in cell wall biosynthesis
MISVIIPIKNAEATIENSLISVLTQECKETIEVLCILNGCTDSTESKVKKFANIDSRIRILYSEPGIVPALNMGLRYANGNLIARQDADDIWHPDKLSDQLDFLEKNPEIDILGTQLNVVDENGSFIEKTNYPLNHNDICNSLLHSNNAIGHPSVIFRKKILDKCAGYLDLFPMAEDMDLWIRAMAWYKFANLEKAHVIYKHVPNVNYNPQVPKILASWYKMIYQIK